MQFARLAIYPKLTADARALHRLAAANPSLAANLTPADARALRHLADATLAASQSLAVSRLRQFLLLFCQNATASTNQNRLMLTLRQFSLTASA